MIDHISIKDFAIIDNVDVDFGPGLSIITGETGSGKSILVTAISLALGSRADSTYVRNGKDKAIVEMTASHNGEAIVISREVNSSGKNLCKLNGRIVTLSELAETCREIADIHGQYDNQSLLNPDNHVDIIDNYKKTSIGPLKEDYQNKYQQFNIKKNELNKLLNAENDNIRKEDFYRFEINEIEKADPIIGEDKDLSDRLSILQNSEKIFGSIKDSYEDLDGSNGAYIKIGNGMNHLERVADVSETLQGMLEELRDIYYRLEDVNTSMSRIMEDLVYDPGEIDSIIERLNVLDSLKRKYSGGSNSIEAVLDYYENIKIDLSRIENFDFEKEGLLKEYNKAKEELLIAGDNLRTKRSEIAEELKNKILKELKDLNFDNSDLAIVNTPLGEPGPNGMETWEISITTNIGEPLKPLAKTSSGGEISRIMLAIKNITAAYDNLETLIFDEIDQGISGKTAAIVGKKLKEISDSHQVICITHLPQIAAKGDSNYRIFKESQESKTYTHIQKLDDDSRIMEIARLLGGETITEKAINNAKELIEG